MRHEYDPAKSRLNKAKHGIVFEEAQPGQFLGGFARGAQLGHGFFGKLGKPLQRCGEVLRWMRTVWKGFITGSMMFTKGAMSAATACSFCQRPVQDLFFQNGCG